MSTPPNFSYAVEQRLRMIDFLLRQYGHINRAVLMDYYGISEACATRDFRAYLDLAPANMSLNHTDKTYYRTVAYASVWK